MNNIYETKSYIPKDLSDYKKVYKQHLDFAIESIEVTFNERRKYNLKTRSLILKTLNIMEILIKFYEKND